MALPESIAGAAGVALFLAAGLGWVELLPALRDRPTGERLALAYLLGVVWTAGGLYALSHLFAVPVGRPAVLTLSALPVLAGLASRLRRRARPPLAPTTPPSASPSSSESRTAARRLGRAALLAGAVVSLAVWAEAVTNPVRDWDGRMTWVAQARFVRAERTVDAAVLRGRHWYVTHPRYPLLLPLAQIAVLDLTDRPDDSHAFRALYAAFFPAYLLLLQAGARRWAGRRAAALATLAAALVPFLPFYDAGGAGGTYSDLSLACFYGAGLLLLLEPRPTPSGGLAAGLLLAGAALTKNEGAPLALAALGLGFLWALWKGRRDRRNEPGAGRPGSRPSTQPGRQAPGSDPVDGSGRRAEAALSSGSTPAARPSWLLRPAVAALPVALALLLLYSWRAGIPNRFDERYGEITTLFALLAGLVRHTPVIAPVLVRTMLSGPHWTLLWWIAPVLFWAGRHGLRRRVALPLLLAALTPPAIAWAAYAIFPNPGFLAAVTWNRFLVQASLPGLWLLALALRGLLAAPLPAWTRRPLQAAGLR